MLDFSDSGSLSPSKSVETDKTESNGEEEETEKVEDEVLTLGRIKRKPLTLNH